MAGRSLFAASVAASIFSLASAAAVLRRNDYPPLPPCTYPYTPFDYIGCYTDPVGQTRALDFSAGGLSQTMTVDFCTATCKSNGFRYAGLEYYGECFCGNYINGPVAASESECSYACTGNKTQICGASGRVSLYMDPTFAKVDNTIISDYKPVGCYSEGTTGRTIQYKQVVDKTTMTTESCLAVCKTKNYPLAATEFGGECYCGVVIANGGAPADSTKCNKPCAGSSSEICGGSGYLNLYVANDLMEAQPCAPVTPTNTMTSTTATPTSTTYSTTTTTTIPDTTSTTSTTTTTTTTPESTTTTSTTTTSSITSTTPTSTSTTSTTTSTTPTSTSTTTTSTTTSTTPTSTTASTTSTTTSMSMTTTTKTTTASTCISTAPAPTCEYGCGKWCSKPLPEFKDKDSCGKAYSMCKLQVADCYSNAGYPDSDGCHSYRSWCEGIGSYYNGWQDGKSNKKDCYSQNPPKNTPPSYPNVCTPTSSSSPSTTTKCIPPTATNVCVLPTGKPGSGYEGGKCVGDIEPPVVTCNDDKDDYSKGNPWKSYNSKDSNKCPSYPKNSISKACQDACNVQYNSCVGTYAESCKGNSHNGGGDGQDNGKGNRKGNGKGGDRKVRRGGKGDNGGNNDDNGGDNNGGYSNGGDDYNSASQKCQNQYNDCVKANQQVNYSNGRCSSYNNGWS